MARHNIKKILFPALLGIFAFANLASADIAVPNPPLENLSFEDVIVILNRFVTWIFTVFMILAVVFGIFAAFKYLTARGDPKEVQTATKMLIYTAVAIAAALLSVAIRFLVAEFLDVPAP